MTFVRAKARILENSITAGNGPYALAGAVDASYNAFSSFMSVGDTVYGSVVEPGVAFWTGILTYSAANEITRTTVEETKGTFGAGTKEIFPGALASTSMFREDIAGAIVTGGTSTAYTVTSFRVYDTLTRLNGNIIAFTPHTTNGATVTLNVDGLGAKPLRQVPSTELLPGVLIQGTPYLALYNHSDQVFYLHGFYGNPYNVPLCAGMDYWGATTPNSAFVFPAGQAISRTTYAGAFALLGTTYGAGNGTTTFNLPDKTGRVSAMKEATATRLTTAGGGVDGGTLGAVGGSQNVTLAANQIPAGVPSSGSNLITVNSTRTTIHDGGNADNFQTIAGTGGILNINLRQQESTGANSIAVTSTNAGQVATKTVSPTIVCNYIMRVL